MESDSRDRQERVVSYWGVEGLGFDLNVAYRWIERTID